jgi:hypothetical protein
MEDRERREKEAFLIRNIMVENGINAIQESGRFNPATLPLPELARSYSYVNLMDGDVQATLVPGLMGKLTDFSRGGRNVVKAMFGCVRTQYPEYGYVRDFFNGHLPAVFTVTEQGDRRVVMQANVDNALARKTFELNGNALTYTMEFKRDNQGTLQIGHMPLLNLDSDVLGIYPKLYIQFPNGWRLMELGKSGTFWYQDGPIDIKGFTGRMVIVAESGECALELTLHPEEVDSLHYEYDRYEFKPEGSSHIFLPLFRTPSVTVEQQGTLRLQIIYRLLLPEEFPDFNAK